MLDGVALAIICKRTQHLQLPQQCKDVQCIMGRFWPIRLCKLTKFGCHLVFNMLMCCYHHRDNMYGRPWSQQCCKSCANGSTLLRYASAITGHKKYWEFLAQNVHINKYFGPNKYLFISIFWANNSHHFFCSGQTGNSLHQKAQHLTPGSDQLVNSHNNFNEMSVKQVFSLRGVILI